jgi:hypothetical protein
MVVQCMILQTFNLFVASAMPEKQKSKERGDEEERLRQAHGPEWSEGHRV